MISTKGALTYDNVLSMDEDERIWFMQRTLKYLQDERAAMESGGKPKGKKYFKK